MRFARTAAEVERVLTRRSGPQRPDVVTTHARIGVGERTHVPPLPDALLVACGSTAVRVAGRVPMRGETYARGW
jgi:hypothetical protein